MSSKNSRIIEISQVKTFLLQKWSKMIQYREENTSKPLEIQIYFTLGRMGRITQNLWKMTQIPSNEHN